MLSSRGITMLRFASRKLALSGWHDRAGAACATGEPDACCVQQLNARPVARACPSLGSKPITTLPAVWPGRVKNDPIEQVRPGLLFSVALPHGCDDSHGPATRHYRHRNKIRQHHAV